MQYRLWSSGKTVDLSREKKLGEGGEAQVFAIAALGLAAKIYHTPRQEHIDKLIVMVKNPPDDPTAAQGHVSIAWPSDLLLHPDGGVSGYVMPMVRSMEPLVSFYVPKLRRQTRPLFDYHYLVTAALNVATAVRALHARNYVIGDVNESNILIAETALATVVDTDSFQVPDPAKRILYRCPVGKPEFTPPELYGQDFARVDRTPEHDRFGLAVLLFQLLMEGTHPFDGVYGGPGEPPPVEGRIAAGHFPHAGGARVPWRPKPIAPPFALLDPALQRLFVQCFTEGHARPARRPDAAAWRSALAAASQTLRTCRANDQHRHWGHVACPWCERAARLRGADPFPSKAAVRLGQHLPRLTVGAPTPSAAPPPRPPRSPAAPPARIAPAPPAPFRAAPAPPVPQRFNPKVAWAVGVAGVVALLVLIIAVAGSGPSSPKMEFSDTPEQGKNFRALAGMNMVWIAPGIFQMGDSTGEGYSDERPVHSVRLSTGYWLGESEVTQGQWSAVMGGNPSYFKGGNLPVEKISWSEAVEFCKKLTERERAAGRLPAGVEYRLPTEAQWEYACRAGTSGDYSGDLDAMAWYGSNGGGTTNSGGTTHKVKWKRPNAWGLYDMHGNVWEWCSDRSGKYSERSQTDPTGATNGANRVYRGGSWRRDGSAICRSASRSSNTPEFRDTNLGFRLAAVQSSGGGAVVAPSEAGTRAGEEPEEAKTFLVQSLKKYIAEPKREAVEPLLQQLAQLCAVRPRPKTPPATPAPIAPAPAPEPTKGGAAPPAPEPPPPYDAYAELAKQLLPLEADTNITSKARLLYAKAELAKLIKKPADADAIYAEMASRFKPEDLSPFLLAHLGDFLLQRGNKERATLFFEHLKEDFPKSDYLDYAYVGLGEIALGKKEYDKALELFTDAIYKIGASSKMKEATIGKAQALFGFKKYAEAKKLFEQVASVQEWRGESTAMAVYSLAQIEAEQGKYPEAIAFYREVFVAYQKYLPWVAKSYLGAAEAFNRMGKRQDAIDNLKEMLRNAKLEKLPEAEQARRRLVEMGSDLAL